MLLTHFTKMHRVQQAELQCAPRTNSCSLTSDNISSLAMEVPRPYSKAGLAGEHESCTHQHEMFRTTC